MMVDTWSSQARASNLLPSARRPARRPDKRAKKESLRQFEGSVIVRVNGSAIEVTSRNVVWTGF